MSSPSFRVGSASVDITPQELFTNWVDGKRYAGVLDPLHVKALAFEAGDGTRGLLLAFDLLETRRCMVESLRSLLADRLGLTPSHVLIHATHTHSAPRFPFREEDTFSAHCEKLACVRDDPGFVGWCESLPEKVLQCARAAVENLQPARMGIRRIFSGDWVYNRRPIKPDGSVETEFSPKNPFAQPAGKRFGVCDPTLTALQFLDATDVPIATLLHFACHPVSIYPTDKRISADWPGALCKKFSAREGGLTFFLQGCAGDQVPIRRGLAAVEAMTDALADRLHDAADTQCGLEGTHFQAASEMLDLPLQDGGTMRSEVQVLRMGDFTLVALPGEPLIGLSLEIVKRSPFPHTICLGYSNGHGTAYVGLPDERARGGYESTAYVSHGTADCGTRLVESAERLLKKF